MFNDSAEVADAVDDAADIHVTVFHILGNEDLLLVAPALSCCLVMCVFNPLEK